MSDEKNKKTIFNFEENDYGSEYKNHLMEQYRIYIDSAERISDRRQKNNDFFLTVNTALLALLGISSKANNISIPMIIIVSFAGIIICYSWYRLVMSYKNINTGKFKVVHKIEKQLPVSLYDVEWKELGEGKNKKLYLPFTHVELKIPWIFVVLYLIVILISIQWISLLKAVCSFVSNC
ncbi:hypothetical protein KAJ89_01830 [Candidatus Parcubacteria bacterium]|nr:hypothetical protein [Candidatus Parcubacteria bacterium]